MEITQAFDCYLPMVLQPRDSQDDKILPKHPKINPKLKSFYNNFQDEKLKWMKSLYNPFSPEERNCECV